MSPNTAWLLRVNALVAIAGLAFAFGLPESLWPEPVWAVRTAVVALTLTVVGYLEFLRRAANRVRPDLAKIPLLNSIATLIWWTDPSGSTNYINQSLSEYSGLEADEYVGKRLARTVHADDYAATRDAWHDALAQRTAFDLECRMRRHDGAYRWMAVSGRPMYAQDGTFEGFAGSCTDIHGRRVAEETLERSQHRLQAYRDQTQYGFVYYEFDPPIETGKSDRATMDALVQARVVDCNMVAAKFLGFPDTTALKGHVFADFFDTSDPQVQELVERYARGGFSLRDYEFRRGDGGQETWIYINGEGVVEDGAYSGAWFTYRDIGERQNMLRDLQRTRFALDNAGEAIFLIDPNTRFLYVNEAACAMFGYSDETLLSMGVSDIDASLSQERFMQLWESIDLAGTPELLESRGRKADGHTFPIEVSMDILNWEGERIAYAFVRDTSDRIEHERQLRLTQYVVDRAPEALVLSDAADQIFYVNDAACALFGHGAEVFQSLMLRDILPDYDRDRVADNHADAEENSARLFETDGVRCDGSRFPAEIASLVEEFTDEKISVAFVRDIKEQKNAEIEHTRFASFVEQTRDAVLRYEYPSPIEPDLGLEEAVEMQFRAVVTNCNKSAADLYNFENASAMLGQTLGDFVDRRDPGAVRGLTEFIKNGFELRGFETSYKRPGGSVGWLRSDSKGEMEAGRYVGRWTNVRDITAGKAAAEALLRSERQRAEFLARTQEAVIYYRYEPPLTQELTHAERVAAVYDAVVMECNDAGARLYEFSSNEKMIGLKFGDLVGRNDPQGYEQIRAFLNNGYRLDQYEASFHTKKRGMTWVAFDAAGVMEDGACTGVWVSSRDITDRIKAERDLRLMRIAIDHSSDAISLINKDGRYVYANNGAERMWGYTKEQLLSKTATELDPKSPLLNFEKFEEDIHQAGGLFTFESTGRRADGSTFPREATIDAFEFEGDRLYCAIQRDVSSRKAAESALDAASQRLESHVDTSPLAVIEWDMDMRITRWSARAERLFEWPAEEAVGLQIRDLRLIHPDDLETANSELHTLTQGQAKSLVIRNRKNLTRSGAIRHCEWHVSRLVGANGELVSMLALVDDITAQERDREELATYRNHLEELVRDRTAELENTQGELVRKEKLSVLGRLTGTVSHELRNPLGTIKSSVYFVRNAIKDMDTAVERALARAERNISRCDKIIDELLDFTRVQKLELESILLDDWLREVVNEFDLPPNVELRTDLGFERELKFEPERLRRCVINVLSNACEAMNDEAHESATRPAVLRIASRSRDGWIEIDFEDTGSGISSENRQKIFEPLYSTKGFGVGLGLPIVKQIVEQHNGALDIVSEVGQGTTVRLSFPAEQ